jgi:hypothetical protein
MMEKERDLKGTKRERERGREGGYNYPNELLIVNPRGH